MFPRAVYNIILLTNFQCISTHAFSLGQPENRIASAGGGKKKQFSGDV